MKLGIAWRLVAATLLRLLGFSWVKRGEEEWNKCSVGLLLFAAGIRPTVGIASKTVGRIFAFPFLRTCWFYQVQSLLVRHIFGLVGFTTLLVVLVAFIDFLLETGDYGVAKVNENFISFIYQEE